MVVDLPVLRSSWIGADAAAAHWRGRRGALPAVRCGACWHAVELDRRSDLRALPAEQFESLSAEELCEGYIYGGDLEGEITTMKATIATLAEQLKMQVEALRIWIAEQPHRSKRRRR